MFVYLFTFILTLTFYDAKPLYLNRKRQFYTHALRLG